MTRRRGHKVYALDDGTLVAANQELMTGDDQVGPTPGVPLTVTSLGGGSGVAGQAFKASTAYKAGDLITQGGVAYYATADFTSGASFSASNWTAVGGGSVALTDATAWAPAVAYTVGQVYSSPRAERRMVVTAYTSGATFGATDTAATVALADPAPVPAAPGFNLSPVVLKKASRALSNVRAGLAPMKLLAMGDSTTNGLITGLSASVADTTSYPARLADQLNGYVPTRRGLAIPVSSLSGANTTTDSRWVNGTGWARAAGTGFAKGSGWQGSNGASGALTFEPGKNIGGFNCDTFDIYFARAASNGTTQVSVDGGSTTAVVTSGATGIGKVTITVTAGTAHVLSFAGPTGGNVTIVGVEAYLSTQSTVRISNAGVGSAKTSDWADGVFGYSSLGMIAAYAPDLTLLMLGVNDAAASVSLATYEANITTLITACQATGDVILASVLPSSNSSYFTFEQSYAAICRRLALSTGCGYVDVLSRFVNYTDANARGYMSDLLHASNLGYMEMTQAFYQAMRVL